MWKCIGCQNEGKSENYEFGKKYEYDYAKEDCQQNLFAFHLFSKSF